MAPKLENNYLRQAEMARRRFLSYDQEALIKKLRLPADQDWLYPTMFHSLYRIHRQTGEIFRQTGETWLPAGYSETMTLLDLVCDSRPDRFPTGRYRNMRDFGHQFHRELLETGADPWALAFQADPEGFRRACNALGGRDFPQGDVASCLEVFDGLCLVVQLWLGDEEFPPNLRLLWDENAPMYLKYETMYFAKDLLLTQLKERL